MPPIQMFSNYGAFTNSSERVRSPSQIFHVGNTGSNPVGDASFGRSLGEKWFFASALSGLT